jgi:hypothetical protein
MECINHAANNTPHFFYKSLIIVFIFLKGSVISLEKVALGKKTIITFLVNRVLVRSIQEMPKCVILFPSATFYHFYPSTFVAWIQGWKQGQDIQPSNLSCALFSLIR